MFYDGLSRLIAADYSVGADYTYGYDVAGNLVNNNGVTRTYNAANQMTNDGTNMLTYDNNGNLTNDGVNSFTWDRANRMLTAPGSTSYKYDGASNRISQTVSGVVTAYLNDVQPGLTQLLAETVSGNTTHYVQGVRGIHATESHAGVWSYFAQDGLGSVRGIVDNVGVLGQTHQYDPYGKYIGTAPTTSYFGFTGEQTDGNRQVYLRARYYNPSMVTFTALDPFKGVQDRPMSLNGYSWVEGNPVVNVDPSGRVSINDPVAIESDFASPLQNARDLPTTIVDGVTRQQLPFGGRSRNPKDARASFVALSLYVMIQRGQMNLCPSEYMNTIANIRTTLTYGDLLAVWIGGEFGNLAGADYHNAVEAAGRWYYDYTQTTASTGQHQTRGLGIINPAPGFQDLELWILLGNVHSFYEFGLDTLYSAMISPTHRAKAEEILSGTTNAQDVTNGFNEALGRPRNWGNQGLLGNARERLAEAYNGRNRKTLNTNTNNIGTYYEEEKEYNYAVWAYSPTEEFALWSESQRKCLQRPEPDSEKPTTGCKVCPSKSADTRCKSEGGDCDCYF